MSGRRLVEGLQDREKKNRFKLRFMGNVIGHAIIKSYSSKLIFFLKHTTCQLDSISLSAQSVIQVESRLGGQLLAKPRQIPFQFGGSGLSLAVEDLGLGWHCKVPDSYQVSVLLLFYYIGRVRYTRSVFP